MYDPIDDVFDAMDAERRLRKASTAQSKRGRNYQAHMLMAKAERNLKDTLAKREPLSSDVLSHFIDNCDRYPAFKEKMLPKVQAYCLKHPRTRKSRAKLLQEKILEMT